MAEVTPCDVPGGSLLASFGGPQDYRDCFCRDVTGEVSLTQFIERFYSSMAFLPERLILKTLRTPASSADIRALATAEIDRFGAWEVVEHRKREILLESKSTGTASWLAVEPMERGTRLLFGSWVGGIERSGWKVLLQAHVWYSRVLLAKL